MNALVEHSAKTVEKQGKDCYFIDHSLGCITFLRYLETLKESKKTGGVVLVAGFTDNLGFKELNSFFTKHIDWKKLKKNCRRFIAIHSDYDSYVHLKHEKIFEKTWARS